jgi:signal transduction histidine kinase
LSTEPLSLRRRVLLTYVAALVFGYALGALTWTLQSRLFNSYFGIGEGVCAWHGWSEYLCTPYDDRARVIGLVATLAVLATIVWLVRLLTRGVLRPVRDMVRTVEQMGPANLGQRVRLGGARDELRTLADSLDEMLDRLAVGFEAQRRFASNASHELRTPLAVQRTLLEVSLVTGGVDPALLAKQLLLVNERNERLIEGLLVLAESDRGLPGTTPVRLDWLVSAVLDAHAERITEHQLTVHRGLVERTVYGDPVLLERLVINLVDNAIKYNGPGGAIEVVVAGAPALSVHNTGRQVPAESVSALFEPFRRLTDERTHQRDGAGLGLSIVRSITTAHHGTVAAIPGDYGGLRIIVHLP